MSGERTRAVLKMEWSGHLGVAFVVMALVFGRLHLRRARRKSRGDAHLVADVHQPSAGIGAEEELDEVELACARRWGWKVSAELASRGSEKTRRSGA